MRTQAKYKSERRQAKKQKNRFGMQMNGKGIKSVILPIIKKKYANAGQARRLEQRPKKLEKPAKNRRKKSVPKKNYGA